MAHFTGILGMLAILAGAYAFSTDRKAIKLKTVLWGLGLQLLLGFFVLRSTTGTKIFAFLGNGANKLLSYSYAGSEFVFGDIVICRIEPVSHSFFFGPQVREGVRIGSSFARLFSTHLDTRVKQSAALQGVIRKQPDPADSKVVQNRGR